MILTLTLMAVGYLVLPIYLGLSEMQTDAVAAVLLPLALCILTYEGHRDAKPASLLLRVLVPVYFLLFLVAAAVLFSGIAFASLIPLYAMSGGILYWYIDKHIPAIID